jgi:hypothetical protein
MKIILCAEDLVKRCLWDTYVYYVVGSEKEAQSQLLENKEFELSERDAIVIGLLKVMETDNLIHRFNDYMIHFLTVKSIKEKDDVLVKKKSLETAIEKFLDKFPDYWTPSPIYASSLKDLVEYINKLREKIDKLDIIKMTIMNINYEFYTSNSIKKMLNFNNY